MIKKTNLLQLSALIPTVLLVGCVAGRDPQIIDANYNFNSTPYNAVVAFSGICYSGWPSILVPIMRSDPSDTFAEDWNAPSLSDAEIPCDGYKHYFFLGLKKGRYSFYQISPPGEIVTNDKPLYFKAVPNKVTYVGSFYVTTKTFHSDGGGKIKFFLRNELVKDMPIFRQHYKNIPSSVYRLGKLTMSK